MKMVMISYNEAMDEEVMDALSNCAMDNYTKFTQVFGKGTSSGTHMGDDIWPGKNNVLFIAADEKKVDKLLGCISSLRQHLGHEGIKAFIMPLERIT